MSEEIVQNPIEKAREILVGVSALTSPESVSRMELLPVTNDAEQEFAGQLLKEIKIQWHQLEDQRTSITGPMNRALRATNDLFRPATKALEKEEAILKLKIADYVQSKERANASYAQLGAQATTPEQATQIIQQIAPVAPPQGVSVRYVWKFEVTDPDAVPREYCSPDPKKIAAADPATAQIPGVRFFQESVVSARSR